LLEAVGNFNCCSRKKYKFSSSSVLETKESSDLEREQKDNGDKKTEAE
jgi:hypothetical protein